jgi:hypothetical protein
MVVSPDRACAHCGAHMPAVVLEAYSRSKSWEVSELSPLEVHR